MIIVPNLYHQESETIQYSRGKLTEDVEVLKKMFYFSTVPGYKVSATRVNEIHNITETLKKEDGTEEEFTKTHNDTCFKFTLEHLIRDDKVKDHKEDNYSIIYDIYPISPKHLIKHYYTGEIEESEIESTFGLEEPAILDSGYRDTPFLSTTVYHEEVGKKAVLLGTFKLPGKYPELFIPFGTSILYSGIDGSSAVFFNNMFELHSLEFGTLLFVTNKKISPKVDTNFVDKQKKNLYNLLSKYFMRGSIDSPTLPIRD